MLVDARDTWGGTPLHNAVKRGDYALVEALLARGAEADAEIPRTGITPLFLSGTAEIAELLLSAGADMNHRDKLGNTAVDVVESAAMKFLLSRGAKRRSVVASPINPPPALNCAGGLDFTFDPYDRKWLCTVDADPYLP
jgi:ankyrin repeat protein